MRWNALCCAVTDAHMHRISMQTMNTFNYTVAVQQKKKAYDEQLSNNVRRKESSAAANFDTPVGRSEEGTNEKKKWIYKHGIRRRKKSQSVGISSQ